MAGSGLLFAALLTFGVSTQAAYLQSAACPGYSLDAWTAGANYTIRDAKLDRASHTTTLSLILGKYMTEEECTKLPESVAVDITTNHVGGSADYHVELEPRCRDLQEQSKWKDLRLLIAANIGYVSTFSPINMRLQLDAGAQGEVACLVANITPAPQKTTTRLLRWIPVGVFVFVLIVSAILAIDQSPALIARTARSNSEILPDASECLFYLQFAFLSSSLTLDYPSFFQPIMSHLNILSLFNTGPLAYNHAYQSVADGIYIVNGTYGGTLGFELMHQLVGVPQTMDTWYNMIIAVLIVTAVIAGLLQIQHCLAMSPCDRDGSFMQRFRAVLKAVLSFFTLPLCALTFYQANYATRLPAYHTALGSIAIVLVLLAFIWLFKKLPSDRLGQLRVGQAKGHEVEGGQLENAIRLEKLFVPIYFSLVFPRGAIIGGLQHFPTAQLSLLLVCEIGHVCTILWLRPRQLFALKLVAITCRTTTLALLCCFLPGLTEERLKMNLGYAILALHAVALVFVFFLPAVYRLGQIIWTRAQKNVPTAYSLRQLNRRPQRSPDHSPCIEMMPSEKYAHRPLTGAERDTSCEDHTRSGKMTGVKSHSMPHQRGFFRQPSRNSMFPVYNSIEHVRDPSTSDLLSKSAETLASHTKPHVVGPDAGSSEPSMSTVSSVDTEDDVSIESEQLGPRWKDFTFRESDLIYGAPFRSQEPAHVPETAQPIGLFQRFRQSTAFQTLDWKRDGVGRPKSGSQTGFQVVRPSQIPRPVVSESGEA